MAQWLRALWGFRGCFGGQSLSQTSSTCPSRASSSPSAPPQQAVCADPIHVHLLSECPCWVHVIADASRWEEEEEDVCSSSCWIIMGWPCPSTEGFSSYEADPPFCEIW